MDNNTIEYKIKTSVDEAANSINKLVSELGGVNKVLFKLDSNLNTIGATIHSTQSNANSLVTTVAKVGQDGNITNVTRTMKDYSAQTENAGLNTEQLNAKIKTLTSQYGTLTSKVTNLNKNGEALNSTLTFTKETAKGVYTTIAKLDESGNLMTLNTNVSKVKTNFQALHVVIGLVISKLWTLFTKTLYSFFEDSTNYIEALNYFNVVFENIEENGITTFSEVGEAATEFQKKMASVFGANPTELLTIQATFQNLTTAQGIDAEHANIISENLTKLAYDIASLQNKEFDDVADKLASGVLSGQVKATRDLAMDLTENSMQEFIDKLAESNSDFEGLYVSNMSYAEKQIVRYMLALEQASSAQGDFANSIESPANQLKILDTNIEKLKTSLGNLMQGFYSTILPYANAIIMTITAIADAIADLLGIEISDYNSGIVSTTSAYADEEEQINDNIEAVEKLKRETLSFDQIHNIDTDTSSDSGDEDDSDSGYYQILLDALQGYDNGLDSVKMKAQEIMESIMGWLGFTYDTEEEVWKFNDGLTKGKVILGLIVGLLSAGVINLLAKAVSFIWGGSALSIGGAFSKLFSFLGSGVSTVFSKITSLFTKTSSVVDTATSAASTATTAASTATSAFKVPNVSTILKGLADLALIVGGVIAFVEVLGLLTKIPGFKETLSDGLSVLSDTFNGLVDVAVPLAATTIFVGVLSKFPSSTFLKGIADFAIIIDGIELLVTSCGLIASIPGVSSLISSGMSTITELMEGLSAIFVPLIEVTTYLGVLGAIMTASGGTGYLAILAGLGALAEIIVGLEAVLIGLGALSSIDNVDWLAKEGKKVLIGIAETIGEFGGTIVSSFVSSAFSCLADVGQSLADFMTNAQPFFDGISAFDSSKVDGVKTLVEVMLMLTGQEILDGLTSWLTGGCSLSDFGKELSEFAVYLSEYSDNIQGVDGEAVESSANAAMALAELANNLPNQDGLVAWFTGDNTLDVWGSYLPAFGKYLKEYSDSISGIDATAIEESANAAMTLAELANNLPNQGGVASWFAGDNTLDVFSSYLPEFGRNLKKYSDAIDGIDADAIVESATAAKSLAELADNLPNQGGMVSWFTGDNTLDVFSSYLPKFGTNLKQYSDNISGIDSDAVAESATAAKSLAELANNLPNQGGMVSWFTGDNTLDVFSSYLPTFGTNLKAYADNISGIDATAISESATAAMTLAELAENLPNQGGILSWFTGDNTIDKFGNKLPSFGKDLKSYSDNIKNIDTAKAQAVSDFIGDLVSQLNKIQNNGLTDTLNNFGNAMKNASSKISTYFSKSDGKSLGTDFGDGFATGMISAIKSAKWPSIKITDSSTNSSIGSYKISAFANGGFPEDGLFMANHNELVGQFSNGKTAVANNQEITQGIKEAVLEAMSTALQNTSNGNIAKIEVYTDDGVIVKKSIKGIKDYKATHGELPFEVI